jgi:hypothetical protein
MRLYITAALVVALATNVYAYVGDKNIDTIEKRVAAMVALVLSNALYGISAILVWLIK